MFCRVIFKTNERMNMEWRYKSHFNCIYGYQKLAENLEFKNIRELGWLSGISFLETVRNNCWKARYNMRK